MTSTLSRVPLRLPSNVQQYLNVPSLYNHLKVVNKLSKKHINSSKHL